MTGAEPDKSVGWKWNELTIYYLIEEWLILIGFSRNVSLIGNDVRDTCEMVDANEETTNNDKSDKDNIMRTSRPYYMHASSERLFFSTRQL